MMIIYTDLILKYCSLIILITTILSFYEHKLFYKINEFSDIAEKYIIYPFRKSLEFPEICAYEVKTASHFYALNI